MVTRSARQATVVDAPAPETKQTPSLSHFIEKSEGRTAHFPKRECEGGSRDRGCFEWTDGEIGMVGRGKDGEGVGREGRGGRGLSLAQIFWYFVMDDFFFGIWRSGL
jgi:hypothetical protein